MIGDYMAKTGKPKKQEKVEVVHPTVTTPIREKYIKRTKRINKIFYSIAEQFPNLKVKLMMGEMKYSPAEFVRKSIYAALAYAIMLSIVLFLVFSRFDINLWYLAITGPVLFLFFFWMWMMLPDAKMVSRAKKIDEEVVFAGRHLVIALRGGITLFDALVSVSSDYGEVSKEFHKIVERISLGESPTQAIREIVAQCPSKYFNRIMLQVVNSIVSGSDLANSLDAVLDQVATEQIIKLKEYGQRLNPLSMFYMLFGIVFPSLGIVFITVILSFTGGAAVTALGGYLLPSMLIVLIGIQFIFLTAIESGRPKFMI